MTSFVSDQMFRLLRGNGCADLLPCASAADETTVAAANAAMNASSTNATADLSAAETLQLTDEVLANLTELQLSNISLFQFAGASGPSSLRYRSAKACKTFPGDLLWPSEGIWRVLDLLLGGALIKTIPYAAPCFDNFGVEDAAKCDFLSTNWSNGSYYQ